MRIHFLLFLSVLSFTCFAQVKTVKNTTLLGIKGGLNMTEATCIRINGFDKRGIAAGPFVRLKLDKRWTGQVELLFTQKGSKNRGDSRNNFYGYYYMSLYYFECPVLFQYHFKKLFLEFGPGFGYLIRSREFFQEGIWATTEQHSFQGKELSFNLGISFPFNDQWIVSCRYTNSVLPIRNSSANSRKYDNIGTLNCVSAITLLKTFQFKKRIS